MNKSMAKSSDKELEKTVRVQKQEVSWITHLEGWIKGLEQQLGQVFGS